jgi:PAS domain S-box-containing protein
VDLADRVTRDREAAPASLFGRRERRRRAGFAGGDHGSPKERCRIPKDMERRQQDSSWTGAGGLLEGLTRVPGRQLVKFLLPLTVVFLLVFALEYRAEVGARRARLLTQESLVVEDGVREVQRGVEAATGDLQFLADLVAGAADGEAPDRLAELERNVRSFLRGRPAYLRIRHVDAAGREIFGIEQAPGGPRAAPERGPDDESGRSHFEEALRLEAGGVHVSLAQPDAERAVGDGPDEPVVRLATPIDDAAGRRRGVVVLSARGGHFMGAFARIPDESGIQRMVVSSAGDWVQQSPEAPSGFVLARRGSFGRTYPDLSSQLEFAREGWAESRDGLFYAETLAPPPLAAAADADAEGRELPRWMLVSLVPGSLLNDIAVHAAAPLLVIATPLYFLAVAIGCLLAAALHRRDEAVRDLIRTRSAMLNAALDGIVVMDEAGTTMEFNPSAQRIFGYTFEEARGRPVADLIIPPEHREAHRRGLERYLATGEARIIGKHIDELTAMRKDGETFAVELTVCSPIRVAGKKLFYGFLRDLTEPDPAEAQAGEPPASA